MKMMIKLNVPYEEKDEAKELGAKYNGKEKFWYIPDGKDFHLFKKWLTTTEIESLDELTKVTAIPLKDLFFDISTTVNPPPKQYKVEGDIHDAYSTGKFNFYTMIDNQNLKQTLRIKTPTGTIPPDEFIDKRVSIAGTLEIYPPYAQFQLKTDETKIIKLGECSRRQKIKKWKEELEDILYSTRPFTYAPLKRIGIIGQKGSRGLTDFKNHLNHHVKKNVIQEEKLVSKSDSLSADTILQYLSEFNAEDTDPCDYVCIVRGGDDPEKLLQYSQPNFVRAIANSKIPIITGIAHDADIDELLCVRAAYLNGGTPTGAAECLNKIAGAEIKSNREREYKKRIDTIVQKTNNDKQRIELLEQECKELTKKIIELQEENERLQQQLIEISQKKKGILARIFG